MSKIWEFFDNLDELVYVSDVASYKIVYMNKKALETYGFKTLDEVVGSVCHEVIQNCCAPCSICNKDGLEVGFFKEWRHYSPFLDKYLMYKDTIIEEDGKRYRMEMAFDVTAEEQRGKMLHNYQNLETMINEGLRVALQADTPSETLEIMLEYLGEAVGGERTYIIERNADGTDDNTYEWVASGVVPEKDNLQNLPSQVCASWYQSFEESREIIIDDVDAARDQIPAQYEILKSQNIHSLVIVPLYDEGEVIGFYGVDNPTRTSFEYALNMLQIMAHFIVSSIKRRNLVQELQELSFCDQLTRVGNRHALNEYIENLQKEKSVGVIYCDVTGLKRVNDSKGHAAGDRLLVQSCECIKEIFDAQGVFRIGGDEMLIVVSPIDESELSGRIEELQEKFSNKEIDMAIGAAWSDNSRDGIDLLMAEAEKRMYRNKAEYYKQLGIDRRR